MRRYIKLFTLHICSSLALFAVPYTDNGNGTVTDSATKLIWQKCSAGQGITIGNCSTGSISTYTWLNAISYCEGLILGGRSDWRLPNVNELKSIVDYAKSTAPTIDIITFPNTMDLYYWTSSTYIQSTANAWFVYFSTGTRSYSTKTTSFYVRCVSGP